jgi:hypothetical protein
MTQSREVYRIIPSQDANANAQALNRILERLAHRLDRIEGLKGNPKFYSTTMEFSDTVSGQLTGTGTTAAFSTISSMGDIAVDSIKVYDSNGTLIHSFGATT